MVSRESLWVRESTLRVLGAPTGRLPSENTKDVAVRALCARAVHGKSSYREGRFEVTARADRITARASSPKPVLEAVLGWRDAACSIRQSHRSGCKKVVNCRGFQGATSIDPYYQLGGA